MVIGVDSYEPALPPLTCAVADARAIAATLADDHRFDVRTRFEADATAPAVRSLLEEELPALLGSNDRLLVYFACHGLAVDGDDCPAGHLLLHDARRADPESFLPMRVLHDALAALPCRHVFVVLDCCFAGSFRWSSLRDATAMRVSRVYRERYYRYIRSAAWQVLASASCDQPAMDRLASDRGEASGRHSPFAAALLRGLRGAADYTGDGLMTASELALFAREQVERLVEGVGRQQTPLLFQLNRHQHGEFVFQVPGAELDLLPAPELTRDRNPYRGLETYEEAHAPLFFGRAAAIQRLAAAVEERPLTVVVGPSGSGKSSLVKAGLVSELRARGWRIASPQRPGPAPLTALRAIAAELGGPALAADTAGDPEASSARLWLDAVARLDAEPAFALVVLDQFEELVSQRGAPALRQVLLGALADGIRRAPRLRIVITIRADMEAALQDGPLAPWWIPGRFPVQAMTRAELREVIERPASEHVLYFEPAALVDRLLDDVALLSAPLPLLSFALSELYRRYVERGDDDRALREADYEALGGAAHSLTGRATALHDELVQVDPAYRFTLRNLVLRMTTAAGGEVLRRRVPQRELVYADAAENRRVAVALDRLHAARLVVRGVGNDGEAYVEPAHDELVRGWDKAAAWMDESAVARALVLAVGAAAATWLGGSRLPAHLWPASPRLDQAVEASARPDPLFNRDEAAFVEASRRRRDRDLLRVRTTVATALVVLATTAVVALVARQNASASAAAAGEAEKRAVAAAVEVRRRLALSYLEQGRQLVVDGDPARALPFLVAAGEEGLDTPVLRFLVGHARRRLWRVSVQHGGAVYAASFSPDGARFATASEDGTAQVWDASTGRPLTPPLRHDAAVLAVSFSPDGTRVATASDDQTAGLWDSRTGRPLAPPLAHDGHVLGAAFSPDGTRLVTITDSLYTRLWDATTGQPISPPLRASGSLPSGLSERPRYGDLSRIVAFSPDGTLIAAIGGGDTVRLRNGSRGFEVGSIQLDAAPTALAFMSNGIMLAIGTAKGKMRFWDVRSLAPVTEPEGSLYPITQISFSRDEANFLLSGAEGMLMSSRGAIPYPGQIAPFQIASFSPGGTAIATGTSDGIARVWAANDRAQMWDDWNALSAPLHHDDAVLAISFSPDGSRILTASADQTARVWDATTDAPIGVPRRDTKDISHVFSPDGRREFSMRSEGASLAVQVSDAATGAPLAPASAQGMRFRRLVFSPDGRRVAGFEVTGDNPLVQVWDVTKGAPLGPPFPGGHHLEDVVFGPDGVRLLTVSWDEGAQIRDAATGAPLAPVVPHRGRFRPELFVSPQFSADGTRIVTLDENRRARVWDAATGRALSPPLGESLWMARLSGDGSRVVTASADRTARVWDAATGAPIGPPLRHYAQVVDAAFSRDGTQVVTASFDRTARVWDATTGASVGPPLQHELGVTTAAFSPDGAMILTLSGEGARIWDRATGKPLGRPLGEPPPQPTTMRSSGTAEIDAASFSSDGTRIVTTGHHEGDVRVWNIAPDLGSVAEWRALIDRCIPCKVADGVLAPCAPSSGRCR